MSRDQLKGVLAGSTNDQHDFSLVLGEVALEDLAVFLDGYLLDDAKYINYDTKEAIGADATNGMRLYYQTCRRCHGLRGKRINFGSEEDPEYVGTLANDNPWEVLHKIRFGNPGTNMPSSVTTGWSIRDVVDVLGYAQKLP